jgi:tetratricopeptide (TPR) repeat protein
MSLLAPQYRIRAPLSRLRLMFGAGALVLAALAVYWNSLGAPFVFDDILAVERNATIRRLWPPWQALNPPADGGGVSGRPLVNLSLAVDHALGGQEVRVYHLTNIALHALAALILWGLLRRTLRLHRNAAPPEAELFAWICALLWTVHPLLTESVVCVVQRNEILGSLFYLLTLYSFARGVSPAREAAGPSGRPGDAPSGSRWLALSVLSCLAGLTCKEMVVTAPLLVLLYDRTFAAGAFRAAWSARKKYYAALAATWLLLAWLVWHNRQRGGTVGFGLGVNPWEYLLTQCRAIVIYLQLSFWPHPLVLDYGWPVARTLGEVWWQALLVAALLTATVVALVRKPAVGFLGACFFVILAPSSSFLPLVSQTIAEHRMYLPLAAVLVLVVAGGRALMGPKALWVAMASAILLGVTTVRRNEDYRTELAIWSDTVVQCPGNARAYGNLGRAYLGLGRWAEAVAACQEELRLAPAYNGDARANLGRALTELGRAAEALPVLEEGLRLKPGSFDLHNNYGMALAALGRWPEAVTQYEAALRGRPDIAELHNNLANALAKVGRLPEALVHYETALRLAPDFLEADENWGRALAEAGRVADALPHFENVVRARPDAAAQGDLAAALAAAGRTDEAIGHYEAALRLQPDSALAHCGLGNTLARLGRFAEAVGQYEAAVRLQPALAEAQHNLGAALMRAGRSAEALPHFEATVRLLPDSADAQHELALVLGGLMRREEAVRHEQEALRLRPDFAEAREHLAWLVRQ